MTYGNQNSKPLSQYDPLNALNEIQITEKNLHKIDINTFVD